MTLFLLGIVLILLGLALDESSMTVRGALTGVGLIVEISLLFLK